MLFFDRVITWLGSFMGVGAAIELVVVIVAETRGGAERSLPDSAFEDMGTSSSWGIACDNGWSWVKMGMVVWRGWEMLVMVSEGNWFKWVSWLYGKIWS